MAPVGPIYASTLHRRDRSWRSRRRAAARMRGLVWSTAGTAVAAILIVHFA